MKFKEMPFDKKVEHIWEYYRFHIIGSLILISIVGSWGYSIATYVGPDIQISAVITDSTSQETLEKDLMNKLGESMPDFNKDKKKKISASSMMPLDNQTPADQASVLRQKFFAELAAGDNDIYFVDKEYLDILMHNDVAYLLNKNVDVKNYPEVVAKEGEFVGKVVAIPVEKNPIIKNNRTYYLVVKRPYKKDQQKLFDEKFAYIGKIMDYLSTNSVN